MFVTIGRSTTVSSALSSATVAIPLDSAGNTTGSRRRLELKTLSGGSHVRFLIGTSEGTAVTTDYLVNTNRSLVNVPGGCFGLAHIASNAVTSILNIASVESASA